MWGASAGRRDFATLPASPKSDDRILTCSTQIFLGGFGGGAEGGGGGASTSRRGFESGSVKYNFLMPTSNRNEIVTRIKANRRALKRFGVKSLALFGSAARNQMRKRSDIDVLVQFDQTTWANYIGLKCFLEDLLGREVVLVTPKALKPATKPSIEKDLLYVVT